MQNITYHANTIEKTFHLKYISYMYMHLYLCIFCQCQQKMELNIHIFYEIQSFTIDNFMHIL